MPCHDTVKRRSMRYNPGREEVFDTEWVRCEDLLIWQKTCKGGGQIMSGCFLAKYLHFLIFRYRKTLKTGQKTDIPCHGQSKANTIKLAMWGRKPHRNTNDPKPDAYGSGCSKKPGQPSERTVPGDFENTLLSMRPAFDMPGHVGDTLKTE